MSNNRGFTLIEVIAALVIGGIILAVAGMGIVKVAEGLVFAQKNASTTLKAQAALTRIEKEFHIITGVTSATKDALSYTSKKGGVSGNYTLTYSAGTILLDGVILVDNVVLVNGNDGLAGLFTYMDSYNGTENRTWDTTRKIIKVTFALRGAGDVDSTFTMRVAPRML
jgi:prepilin-type N-terminal cleavage/methylation domain-containing protein